MYNFSKEAQEQARGLAYKAWKKLYPRQRRAPDRDRSLLLKVGLLIASGRLAEPVLRDAVDAVISVDPRSRMAYLHTCLVGESGGSKAEFNTLLAKTEIPAEMRRKTEEGTRNDD